MDKEYYKKYRQNNTHKFKPGIGVKEISIIKMCVVTTVNRNKHLFDVIPNTKPPRFYLNGKVLNWYPEYNKGMHKHN